MLTIYLILYVLAALCFLAYALKLNSGRVSLLGLGVFFWALVPLITTAMRL